MHEWIVSAEDSGCKLVTFLGRQMAGQYSARALKRAIESNCCQINGCIERFASAVIGEGDRISLVLEHAIEPVTHQLDHSRILYEDSDLLVYDKPAGLTSDDKGVLNLFHAYAPSIQLIHRLDRDTTGVLLLAKSPEIFKAMVEQFRHFQVRKTYVAIVDGALKESQGVIENYLGKKHAYAGQAIWGSVRESQGLYARTEWKRGKMSREASLVYCFPKTGRTHQLRVHLAGIGHPILGDFQYAKQFQCPYQPPRYLLHASELEFAHPRTGRLMLIQAPLPEDFQHAERILFKK